MQPGGWANKTSKKARKRKVAGFTKGSGSENDKKKKKSSKRKNGSHQNIYNKYEDYSYEDSRPMLSGKQYRISQKIAQFWPNYKCEHVLPKIIMKLNLTNFDPNDERQKIEILDCLLCELQDAITMSGKSKKNKRERERREREREEREREKRERKNKQNQLMKTKSKSKKSGKFRQFMVEIGNIFLDYLDRETLSTLIRIESFAFIHKQRSKILTTKQRLIAYISPKDISFRIKSFNSKLNTLSSLKLYKFKTGSAAKELSTTQYIRIIMLNMFNLDHRFRIRTSAKTMAYHPNMIQMDVRKNYHLSNDELIEKIIKSKCKIFNVWNVIHITDVNEGYLSEFGEHQDGNTTDEKIFLNDLNEIIVDKSVLSQKNIKSMHCGYVKVIENYELRSFLCLFIQLNTNNFQNIYDQNTRQFMVWNGQCGIKSIQRH